MFAVGSGFGMHDIFWGRSTRAVFHTILEGVDMLIIFILPKLPRPTILIYPLSLPSLPSSPKKLSALTNSVLPYITLFRLATPAWPALAPPLVRFAQSCRLPYSSILPPPTVKTIASLKPCRLCPKLASMPRLCAVPLRASFAEGGMVPRALAERGSKYRNPSVFCRALVKAFDGSISDSVILVRVRSLLAGRKFFTPEMRLSKFAPRPASLKRSVRREEMDEKPRNRSVEADVC